MARFSKSLLLVDLEERANHLKARHGFTQQDGTNQVEKKSLAVNRAYGEWDMLCRLIEKIRGGYIGR